MLLNVIEAKGEDFKNHLKKDFRPVSFIVFCCHSVSELLFVAIDIVYAHQCAAERSDLSESYQ